MDKERLLSDISLVFCCFIAFTLPFNNIFLNNAFIFLLSVVAFYNATLKKKSKELFTNKYVIFLSLLYLVQIAGLIYTEDLKGAYHHLEVKFTLLLMPMVFFIADIKKPTYVLLSFISSLIICQLIIWLFLAYLLHFTNVRMDYGYLVNLICTPLSQHHVYFSMFLLWSICIVYLLDKFDHRQKMAIIFPSYLLILLLSSRTVVILATIIIFIGIFIFVFKRFVFIKAFLISIFSVMLAIIVIYQIPFTKDKLMQFKFLLVNKSSDKELAEMSSGVSGRLEKWDASVRIIKENLIIGVGTGDARAEMLKWGEKLGYEELVKYEYNSHNEYLSESVRHGIVGLICLLFYFFTSIYLGIKSSNQFIIFLNLIFMMICLTESMLSIQKGVVFYSFFNSLLIFSTLNTRRLIKQL